MEGRNLLRFLFFLVTGLFLLLFTWANFPYLPSNKAELLDCTSFSPWCTSKSKPHLTTNPSNPTRGPRRHHSSDVPHHPLDPLTVQEINRVRTILSSHAPLKASKRYTIHAVDLEEPAKPLVLRWKKGNPMLPRRASVIALVGGESHLLTVDLATSQVTRDDVLPPSGYPTMTVEDMTMATKAPLVDGNFNRTIIERGIDLADLACLPLSTGWFGKSEEKRRLIKVQCYSLKDTVNFYMRPIEGLTVLVDLDSKQVVEISDRGQNIPIPNAANTDYRYSAHNKTLKTAQLYWTNPAQINALKPPFDVVIATDVVYIEESVASLVAAMEALVSDNGVVLLGYQLRSPEADRLFWEVCARVFAIEKIPHEDLHPEYAYEEADVFVLRKK